MDEKAFTNSENRNVLIGSGNGAARFLRLLLATNKTAFLTALRYEALFSLIVNLYLQFNCLARNGQEEYLKTRYDILY